MCLNYFLNTLFTFFVINVFYLSLKKTFPYMFSTCILSTISFRLVLEGCPLIAIHKARYYKKKEELALGPGKIVSISEHRL